MGAILLFDAQNGYPLAILDSIEITIKRTGAATAVAARRLARPDSRTVTLCGCGNQGRVQLESLRQVLPIERVYAFDADPAKAAAYAGEMSAKLSIEVEALVERDLEAACGRSDIIVTCTPSKRPFLMQRFVRPGTFVAAVGADSPDKQEMESGLLAGHKVVGDILEQCARVGELHHAIEAGLMRKEDAHGELGEVLLGKVAGRDSDEEIIVYDATGTALQDTAAAAACYRKALQEGQGTVVNLFD